MIQSTGQQKLTNGEWGAFVTGLGLGVIVTVAILLFTDYFGPFHPATPQRANRITSLPTLSVASPIGPIPVIGDKDAAAAVDTQYVMVSNAREAFIRNSKIVALSGNMIGDPGDKKIDTSYNVLIFPSKREVRIPATDGVSGNRIYLPDEGVCQ